jgi:hypothetical protein
MFPLATIVASLSPGYNWDIGTKLNPVERACSCLTGLVKLQVSLRRRLQLQYELCSILRQVPGLGDDLPSGYLRLKLPRVVFAPHRLSPLQHATILVNVPAASGCA